MNVLNVPTVGISELKRAPAQIFQRAGKENNAVYVFNRGVVVGVVLTREQFEKLNARVERLDEVELDKAVSHRLRDNSKVLSDSEVRGHKSQEVKFDKNDGWE
jgi:hypothetical protein